jgi:DDB1- and CUL4-associated factor 13
VLFLYEILFYFQPREYQRALTATKIEKIFAQPFLGVLAGHSDGISVMAKSSTSLTNFISGSYDGELRFWDLSQRQTTFRINAHERVVKGLTFSSLGANFLSCGDDKMINLYSVEACLRNKDKPEPVNKFISKYVLNNVDHSWKDSSLFATSGQIIQLWNYERSLPVQTFEWGADSVTKVRFNSSEVNLLASIGSDRSFVFYDIRAGTPLKKTLLNNKSSGICWNPMEPFVISLANDDGNCYTFDMRKLEAARMIHKDHIQAV